MKVRPAKADDMLAILRWREEAAHWLHQRGSDQWSDAGLTRNAFIHRMITGRSAAGRGVGKLMLDHAENLARRDGRKMFILDAWTSNPDLHAYYESQEFRQVRTVTDHYTSSATLFERPVSAIQR